MSCLRFKTKDCVYKERDRRVEEQFKNSIYDKEMMNEISRELTASKETNKSQMSTNYAGQRD